MKFEKNTVTSVSLSEEQLISILKQRGVIPYNADESNTTVTITLKKSGGEILGLASVDSLHFITEVTEEKRKSDSFMHISFRPGAGEGIAPVINEAIAIAKTYNHDVSFKFNGRYIKATPTSTLKELFAQYDEYDVTPEVAES